MITYDGLELFSSGPSRIKLGPAQSRDAVADVPGAIGAMLIGQGVRPRAIDQQGTLVADDEPALRALTQAIEAQVGAAAAMLTDEHGNALPGCVMREFNPGRAYRMGPRFASDYTVSYLQTTPS